MKSLVAAIVATLVLTATAPTTWAEEITVSANADTYVWQKEPITSR